jgi:alpha-L-rhamnosidase
VQSPTEQVAHSTVPLLPVASWIEPVERDDRARQRPAYHLAREFPAPADVVSAILHLTARGLVEPYLNGVRACDEELLPGHTAYRKRLPVHCFDVTQLMTPGINVLGILLSDGWWRGQGGGATRLIDAYGTRTAVRAELHLTTASGEKHTVCTDAHWRSTRSHILAADLIAGEVHDLRLRVPDWASPAGDRSSWDSVRLGSEDDAALVPAWGPPVRRIEELASLSVHELAPERHVVDFGQNSNGWVRVSDLGPAGTMLRLVYGEVLDDEGDVSQAAIAHMYAADEVPFQTDLVTSAGDGAAFEPRHSTKGFRYVRIEGHPGPLTRTSVVSVVVHSDLRRIGGFSCSDDRLNRLHAAAEWSFRGNACGIPTDCPHRERAGWTGDWQVFVPTAAYLYDVHDFSARWLEDLAAEQWNDGTVLNIVPEQHDLTLEEHARWRSAQGSSGWGDAACHVPWELYLAYGREEVLRAQLASMQRWVDYAAGRATGGRHPQRAAARPDAAAHEQFIWDTGFHFGEWTEPDAPPPAELIDHLLTTDHGPTATAFLYRSARELAHAAAVLGDDEVAERYSRLAEDVRAAWITEFVDADGHVQPQRQANLVRALAFDLLPAELRWLAADDLVRLIRHAGTHVGTGFLATPYLLPVLADAGHLDVAYDLLLQDTPPSWLYMVDQGATTIWEDWSGQESQNHYSKGAVVSFLHHYTAGLLLLEPGYRRFRVAPRPGGGLSSASTWHDSPYGRIRINWTLDKGLGQIEVDVPPGSEAELVLPDGTKARLTAGEHSRTWRQSGDEPKD